MTETLKGVLILRIEHLIVHTQPRPDMAAAAFLATMVDGVKIPIGLTAEALEDLCRALVDNSPRTPGTPGRN